MESTSFSCPLCGAQLKTTAASAGKRVRCPKCERICVAPAPAMTAIQTASRPAPLPVPTCARWRQGQRVFAQWSDGFSYPASVQACDTQSVKVTFDDGAVSLIEPDHVKPIDLAIGDRIFARWQKGAAYFPGQIADMEGENLTVHYDDGEQEQTTVSMTRVFLGEMPWKVGDRVLAHWPPESFFYPARITAITHGVFVSVAYDDGESAELLPMEVAPLDLREGDRVYCRWQKGPEYHPGSIAEKQGDKIHVHYDDGEKEWSTVAMVRVLPEDVAP